MSRSNNSGSRYLSRHSEENMLDYGIHAPNGTTHKELSEPPADNQQLKRKNSRDVGILTSYIMTKS